MGNGRSNADERRLRESENRRRINEEAYEEEEEDYVPGERIRREEYPASPRRRSPPSQAPSIRRQSGTKRRTKPRSVWPYMLTGCGLGVGLMALAAVITIIAFIHPGQGSNLPGLAGIPGIPTTKAFTKSNAVDVPISTITQVQICDRAGNVTMKVDANATSTTVATTKTVHATNQSIADSEFQKILVEVQPPGNITNELACAKAKTTATSSITGAANSTNVLTVNITFPTKDNTTDAVDIIITVPHSATPNEAPSMQINVEAPLGNVHLDQLSGVINIRGGSGVVIQNAVLVSGSKIETAQGNVTFSGFLDIPTTPDTPANYIIQSEGGIDITLPANTNVTLDANTNTGAVNNEFGNNMPNRGGPVNYYGPLNHSANTKSAAILHLDGSTGDVTIRKAQSQ